jgi:hypothetical protein
VDGETVDASVDIGVDRDADVATITVENRTAGRTAVVGRAQRHGAGGSA